MAKERGRIKRNLPAENRNLSLGFLLALTWYVGSFVCCSQMLIASLRYMTEWTKQIVYRTQTIWHSATIKMLTIAYYLLLELQNCERDRKGAKRGRVFIYYKKGLGEGGGKTTKYCRSNETRLLAIDYNGVDVFGINIAQDLKSEEQFLAVNKIVSFYLFACRFWKFLIHRII